MPETVPTHSSAETYFPPATPRGAVEPTGDGRAVSAVRTSSAVAEASQLLLEGQRLLQESRVDEAERVLLRALELYEQQDDPPADCVQLFTDLGSILTTRGDLIAACSHLERALSLANARFAEDHPDVAAILGRLAQLYLRCKEFTKAEPLLQRLLEIKRARGDENPEVATVLASLATIRSAIGAHESAERILRRVLAVREKTLAPNHFATIATVEHLAESCAARGKFEESLTLLHRALTMRERTLGVSHPSITAARTRIADLELLSSNEQPGSLPALPPMMGSLPELSDRHNEPVHAAPTPPQHAISVREASPHTVTESLPPRESLPPVVRAEYLDPWVDEIETWRPQRWLLDQLNAKVALVTAFARTPRGRVMLVAIGITSLLTALVLGVRTPADIAVASADASLVSPPSPASARSPVDANAATTSSFAQRATAPTNDHLTRSEDVFGQTAAATEGTERSARSEARDTRATTKEPDVVPVPKAPKVRLLEMALRPAPISDASGPIVGSADFVPSGASSTQGPAREAATAAHGTLVPAVLTANNPAPDYPPDLMRQGIEGRVVAQFIVDTKGRVDTRTLRIITSTDGRFSEAVRAVLPNLRFLPAERDGVKTEEWVSMPFRFSPKPE